MATLLEKAARVQSLTPTKSLAMLGEVTSHAVKDGQVPDLLQTPLFASLLERVENRLYGFAVHEVYLLVLCICRAFAASKVSPGGDPNAGRLLKSAVEQLAEDLEELSSAQLVQLMQLRKYVNQVDPDQEFWHALQQAMLRLLRGTDPLSPKLLCLAVEGLKTWPKDLVNPKLLEELVNATESCLDDFSSKQLVLLGVNLTSLGVHEEVVSQIAERLRLAMPLLPPRQLCLVLEMAALSAVPQALENFLPRCLEVAHSFPAPEAIRVLRAMACLGIFSKDLVILLLMQVSKVPRSSLTDAEDRALHQVMLSLLHDPTASELKDAIASDSNELWESCYRPEEAVLEATNPTAVEAMKDVPMALEAAGVQMASTGHGHIIQRFYWCPLMLQMQDGRWFALDLEPSEQQDADLLFARLKQRHLELWGIQLLWRSLGDPAGDLSDLLTSGH